MDNKQIQMVWLALCYLFNFIDATMTLIVVSKGVEEANPVMAYLLSFGPAFFIITKFIVFALAVDFIARRIPKILPLIGILFMMVVCWHCAFWFSGAV